MRIIKVHPGEKFLDRPVFEPSVELSIDDICGDLRIKIMQHFVDVEGVIEFRKSLSQPEF